MPSPSEALDRRVPSRLIALAIALVIVAVTAWAYRPALDADFVLDDATSIVDNPAIHWTEVSWQNFQTAWNTSRLRSRFVANVSFAFNHVAGGLDPFGYHLTNVLIHLAVGAALAFLIGVYLRAHGTDVEERRSSTRLLAIGIPVALFLVHPLNTQAVTYVVQRMTSLAALFALLSLAVYIGARTRIFRGPRAAWFGVAALLWLLGLQTKENVLAIGLVILAYEWCFCRGYWSDLWRSLWSERRRRPLILAGGLLGAAAALLLLESYVGGGRIRFLENFPTRDFNGEERLATQARAHWLYLSQLLWPAPSRLNLDHDFAISRTLLSPLSTVFAIVGVLALIGASVWVAAKKPWIGFPLLAYWALHSIESGPISLEMVFEHRMYLPMAMLALAAAVLICGQGRRRKPILAMATVAIALLAGATHARNETWSDLVRLAEDTARKSPLKRRAQADLGVAYLRAGRYEEAEEALLIAIELEPTLAKTRQALGALYLEMGRPEEAAAAFNTANVYDPDEPRIKYAIGEALEAQGQTEEAFAYYIDLGTRYGMEGKPFPAIEPLRRAVRLKPEDSFARNSLGNVYLMAEMLDAALEEYRKAVELAPRNAQAIYNLATTLDRLGEYEEAAGYYRQFVGIAPPDLADYARHASERVQEIESAGL